MFGPEFGKDGRQTPLRAEDKKDGALEASVIPDGEEAAKASDVAGGAEGSPDSGKSPESEESEASERSKARKAAAASEKVGASIQERTPVSRLLGMLRPHWLKLGLAVISMALAGASTAGMAYLIKPLLDNVFFESRSSMLMPLTLLTLGVFTATGVFTFLQSYLMNKIGYTIVNDLRVKLFSHIQKQSLQYHDEHPSGELISRVVNDVTLIQSSVTQVVTGLVMDLCKVVGLVVVLFSRDWRLALIGLLLMPAAVAPISRFGRKLRRLATDSQVIMGSLIVVLTETFQGVRMVQSYNMTEFEIARFSQECRRNVDNLMRSVTVRSLSSSVMEIFGGLCLSAVIWYGGHSVIMGESTPGTFFSFMTAILLLYEPLKRLTRLHNEFQQGLSAAVRIFETLDSIPAIISPPPGHVIKRARGAIDFSNVHFAYEAGREALSGINLSIKPGEVLALVGHSGGGKTSLVNLVPRFYDPTKGAILLDGQDIRTADLRSLREQIALVSQDVTLFDASVRHNIAYGRLSASFEEIEAAAKAALADGFIAELPGGYEENIGERGGRLSGGQRQRLAIARAILKDAPILILDEATSALDTESEKYVQAALENLMQGRTTLVIAHRLSTIVRADRIVVLKEGRIAEEGRHEDLMKLNGEYHRLYSLQFMDAQEGLGRLGLPVR
ncbi:MAG: lipid A export permease/ATP-binding protein MsbA [Deltaproteobacteria bacterium]|jgi:subfamily B ATP-binding cassette protein MsbA|nr:lipid A export permease/ATP-binding protein MsbA [Deltaproteobacteria bacterium]